MMVSVGVPRYGRTMALEDTVVHHTVMRRTVVWLTDQQAKALARMSEKSLAPVSALVRQAVKEFLQKRRKYRARKSGQL